MPENIPIFDVSTEAEQIELDVQQILSDILRAPQSVNMVKMLEEAVADYLDVAHVLAMESLVEAYLIGLDSLGLAEEDEVIIPANASPLLPNVIRMLGAVPVFVDIDPQTFNLAPRLLEEAITPASRVVVVTHMYGYPAEMNRIFDTALIFGLDVLEDTTWAFGAGYQQFRTGALGDVAVANLGPGANFSAFGKAAFLMTDDDELGRLAKMLRYHGEILGYGSEMGQMQAATLYAKLRHIEFWNAQRRHLANLYNVLLHDVPGLELPPVATMDVKPTYAYYAVRVKDGRRAAVQAYLRENGIDTRSHFPVPLHWLPDDANPDGQLVFTEEAADEVMCLPMWPHLEETDLHFIVQTLKKALESVPQRKGRSTH